MKNISLKKLLDYLKGYISVITWCISFSWRASRFYTMIHICGAIILPILSIASTFVVKNIINLLTKGGGNKTSENVLLIMFSVLLLISLLRKAIQTLSQYSQLMHGELMNGRISLIIIERSLKADLEYFDNPAFNDKLTSVNQDSYAIANILWNVISTISATVSFVGVFLVICQANIWYATLLIASAVPSSLIAAKYTQSHYKLSISQINGKRQMSYIQSLVTHKYYAQEIRLFNIGDWMKQRFGGIWRTFLSERRDMNRKRAIITGLLECLPEFVITLISIDIAFDILNSRATLGDYTFYTGLIGQLCGAVYLLSTSAMEIYGNKLKIDNMKTLSHFENHIEDNGILKLKKINTIAFKNIYFTYPGASVPALNDVSFELDNKKKVAIVGLNGSGKSTLIKLLLRMYEPDSGMIYINGINIQQYKITELRSNFSVYFQEMHNYGFTIRENFIISDSEQIASDSIIETVLKKVYFTELLNYSPKRCDANLMKLFAQDGIELSGGQFQKLALARAFFRRHTALILDEPSSNLDPLAEKKVFEALETLTAGKLTIFTSHHLSNIYLADRIIVLEDGKIVEDGTHLSLLQNNQRYAELFRYKQEKYNII